MVLTLTSDVLLRISSVGSSSQLTLRVLEENEDCGQDGILATFLLTYQMLCLTKNGLFLFSS